MTILENDFGLFFHQENILVSKTEARSILALHDIYPHLKNRSIDVPHYFLGDINQQRIHAIEISPDVISPNVIADNAHFCFLPIREQLNTVEPELFHLICQGKQLLNWHKISQFCSVCGVANSLSEAEIAKICPKCQRVSYPAYSPAVIVLIERENQILLARSHHFRKGVYSPLAGFVAPGEAAEQAVIREVYEEVGLLIEDVQYFGSQSWPFPDSFMLAYTAKYKAGDLKVDHAELEDARWFTADALPLLPSPSSISRWLVDAFLRK